MGIAFRVYHRVHLLQTLHVAMAKAMKAMKVMKKKAAMKAMKAMKKKAVSKIATGSRAKAKKAFKNTVGPWCAALAKARKALKITGFVAVKKGTPLYAKAKELYTQ